MLLYHDPSPETLDKHLSYLKQFCEIVPFSEIDQPGRGRPRAVVTLDDGCAGNAKLLPIFIKHNIRPTIFICSQIVGAGRQFWWQHGGAQVEGHKKLKRLPNAERLELLKRHGYGMLSVGHASALSTQDIEQMKPWVDFQAHTRFHPILPMCDDAECASEISLSRHEIERLVGNHCVHFAYPNGNYGSREIEYVKAAGYRYARTCDVGWNDMATDPYRLKCIPVDDAASVSWFAAKLSGIPLFLRYMANGSFNGKMPQL
jgi:peptidoglycan/xylan/chitin deacetylase (PgdA/CDA1 family)